MNVKNPDWWKDIVVYQVYTRSFLDSNGDGIGDIPGIISKLNHFSDLGVDMIWLSPFCKSPNDDNGYDVSEYTSVQEEFGTMAHLEELIRKAEDLGIGIMMDLVLNHSSDEHPWFQQSRSSRDNPKRNWYHWKDPGPAGGVPNNWNSYFGGPTWTFDEITGQYYLHTFASKQPDLNWENPEVRQALYEIAIFWAKKGIKAFRLDAIHHIGKPLGLPDYPHKDAIFKLYKNHPNTHQYLKEMAEKVFRPFNIFTVGETGGTTPESALDYIHHESGSLDLIFHFNHCFVDSPKDPKLLRRVLDNWSKALISKAWDTSFFSNHDLPRQVSVFGEEGPYRVFSAQAIATLLLTYWGTPFLYQGEEWGMTNAYFSNINDYRDKHAIAGYRRRVTGGMSPPLAWAEFQVRNRDNSRVPLRWDNSRGGGFSQGEPWIPYHPRIEESLQSDQESDNGVYQWYKKLITLRKSQVILRRGGLQWVGDPHDQVLAYLRTGQEYHFLVLINWVREHVKFELTKELLERHDFELLLCNHHRTHSDQNMVGLDFGQALSGKKKEDKGGKMDSGTNIELHPYECRIYRLSVDRIASEQS
jgi:glycosidase